MRLYFRLILVLSTTALFSLSLTATSVEACSRSGPFSFEELFVADVIVRATAVSYVSEPDLSLVTTGVPDTKLTFHVEEVLKGKYIGEILILNGYLSNDDDYNEVKVPYTFVRPNGRSGSCFANTYKEGAQFLLFLKKTKGGYTSNISALGPANEQLRGPNDPWLEWARNELKTRKKVIKRAKSTRTNYISEKAIS